MKKIRNFWKGLLAALIFTSAVFVACTKNGEDAPASSAARAITEARPTGTCQTYEACNYLVKTLLAGQTILIGDYYTAGGGVITQKLPNGDITVTFTIGTAITYELDEVHVYIGNGSDLGGSGGAVSPGQFPYKIADLPAGTKTVTVTISAADLAVIPKLSTSETGDCYVIAAHASVSSTNGGSGETAWGCGDKITDGTGGSWAMSFTFCTRNDCEVTPPTTHCTLSQGYWLANTADGQVRASKINWGGNVVFGGVSLSQNAVASIFPAKTSVPKKALFQATALQLNLRETDLEESDVPTAVLTAYQYISTTISNAGSLDAYLKIKDAATLKKLQAAASAISDYIKAAHCGTAVFDQESAVGTI